MRKFSAIKDIRSFRWRQPLKTWGLVPTNDASIITKETVSSLLNTFEKQLNQLISLGYSENVLLRQVLITPSCGTGSLPVETATKVLGLNQQLSDEIQRKFQIN